jgi:flagellum-specific peptidoglycan hydrolase FlgJ
MSFFTDYLNDAQIASSQTGVLVSVILAQCADETTYGQTLNQQGSVWNFAGVSSAGKVLSYSSEQAGLSAYIRTLNLH